MFRHAHRIGAVCYALWGAIHVAGGAVFLATLKSGGGAAVLSLTATAMPADQVPATTGGVIDAVIAYHSWNLLWIGLLVTVVAITLNWKNRRAGFWVNLALVSATDLGLLGALILPGVMNFVDGIPGLSLWAPAAVFSAIGLMSNASPRVPQPAAENAAC